MITRRRTPLSSHLTDADRKNAADLHAELAADVRETVSGSALPKNMMAIVVVHPLGERAWLAEQLRHAGFESGISLEPDAAPIVVIDRQMARAVFEGTPVAKFFETVAGDRWALCYGLPRGRWICADPPNLPPGRGQA